MLIFSRAKGSPLAAAPLLGNFYFTMPAQPFLGSWEVPFVTRGEFLIPCTRGFAARAGIIPSRQIRMKGLAQSLMTNLIILGNHFDNFYNNFCAFFDNPQ
jgi:hypothetical protein